jgi:hypothetical protein
VEFGIPLTDSCATSRILSDIVKLRGNVIKSHRASRRQRRTDGDVEDDDTVVFDLFDVRTSNNKVKTLALIPKVRTEIQFKRGAKEWLRAFTPGEDSDVTADDIAEWIITVVWNNNMDSYLQAGENIGVPPPMVPLDDIESGALICDTNLSSTQTRKLNKHYRK